MNNALTWGLGLLAAGFGAAWWMEKQKGPAWQEGQRLGSRVTVSRVGYSGGQWAYYIMFDEVPGTEYGPFTKAEVLAQL